MAAKKKVVVETKQAKINTKMYEIILGPIVTEKSQILQQNGNKVTFQVKKDTNKAEVRIACEALFGAKVVKVNIVNVLSKVIRRGKTVGKKQGYKKAIVSFDKEANINTPVESAD